MMIDDKKGELESRQRKEAKELMNEITALKKTVAKGAGDKKKVWKGMNTFRMGFDSSEPLPPAHLFLPNSPSHLYFRKKRFRTRLH